MWFLWIVITAIVILFNFTQLLGLIVAKVKGRSVDNFWASFALHSGVVFVWLVLCATIEAINKYRLVNLFSWIGFMIASCFIVKRNMNEINSVSRPDSDKPAAVSTIVPKEESEVYTQCVAENNKNSDRGTPESVDLPVDKWIKNILKKYRSSKMTKNDWEIVVTDMEKLNTRQPCVLVQDAIASLYFKDKHGNFNGAAYWMRKKVYSAMKEDLYKQSVATIVKNNTKTIIDHLDANKAKPVKMIGYGYEINNPIISTWFEYALMLNSLKPDNGELIYYFRAGNVGHNIKGHIIDKFYLYVADDTIEHNLYRYEMYFDLYNGFAGPQYPAGFKFNMSRMKVSCGDTNYRPPKNFTSNYS